MTTYKVVFKSEQIFTKFTTPYIYFRSIIYGTDIIFLLGGGGGGVVTFLGLADNFFLKNIAFQTIFFITFCNEINFFTTILKNISGFFLDLT